MLFDLSLELVALKKSGSKTKIHNLCGKITRNELVILVSVVPLSYICFLYNSVDLLRGNQVYVHSSCVLTYLYISVQITKSYIYIFMCLYIPTFRICMTGLEGK